MPRLDLTTEEKNIDPKLFVRALVTLMVQQFNQLRAYHNLPALTRAQVIAAIKAEVRNLP